MQTAVLGLGFVVGIGAFVLWLTHELQVERRLRVAEVRQSRARVRSHRHAARTARPVAVPVTTHRVVRAGAFCRVIGSLGRSKRGATLVCAHHDGGRPRWAKADVDLVEHVEHTVG
jgi:hypothetical protein